MARDRVTFGMVVSGARKNLGLSQKEFAAKIEKDEGTAISAQYLNDIEHDRRNPPSANLLNQFATLLDLDSDYLYYLAGQFHPDLRLEAGGEQKVKDALKAFRKNIHG